MYTSLQLKIHDLDSLCKSGHIFISYNLVYSYCNGVIEVIQDRKARGLWSNDIVMCDVHYINIILLTNNTLN